MAKINSQPDEVIDTVVANNVKGGNYLFAFYPGDSREPHLWFRGVNVTKMRQMYDAIGKELKRITKGDPSVF